MNTKYCPKCGKELPQEAVFCPYCMTKLIDVKTGKDFKVKKKNYALPFVIIAAAVLIIAAVVVLFVFMGNSNTDIQVTQPSANTDEINYSNYIGLWSDKDNDIDSVTDNGGNLLEIISVKDDVVRFTFTKISSAPDNRIARISNVTSKIIDGTGTFTFDDDNWQNSGTGKIKFIDDEIYLETNITNRSEYSMWDIGGSFYLVKSDKSLTDFKNYNYIGSDFDEVKRFFGEETQEKVSIENIEIHYFSGIQVQVNKRTNLIVAIYIDYSGVPMSKSNLCYGEIDGNSTYDDVYRVLGEPSYNNISNNFVTYTTKNGTLIFYFDDNMYVKAFSLEIEV